MAKKKTVAKVKFFSKKEFHELGFIGLTRSDPPSKKIEGRFGEAVCDSSGFIYVEFTTTEGERLELMAQPLPEEVEELRAVLDKSVGLYHFWVGVEERRRRERRERLRQKGK